MNITRRSRPRGWTIGTMLLLVLYSVTAVSEQPIHLKGQVQTQDNRPIAGVSVAVYREQNKVGTAWTNGNGEYDIPMPRGQNITRVEYRHNNYYYGYIRDISGIESHNITKVLFPLGADLNVNQAFAVLSALQATIMANPKKLFWNQQPYSITDGEYVKAYFDKWPADFQAQMQSIQKVPLYQAWSKIPGD